MSPLDLCSKFVFLFDPVDETKKLHHEDSLDFILNVFVGNVILFDHEFFLFVLKSNFIISFTLMIIQQFIGLSVK